jgi:hypothetical protein
MPSSAGHRRLGFTDAAKAWTDKLKPGFVADHPRHRKRFDAYVNYIAFLTAGAVEHQWSEAVESTGRPPFAPLKRPDSFLLDLQLKIRAFRESRFVDGLSSPELVRHSFDLLNFLSERVPHADLERYLAVARTYLRANEDECLTP